MKTAKQKKDAARHRIERRALKQVLEKIQAGLHLEYRIQNAKLIGMLNNGEVANPAGLLMFNQGIKHAFWMVRAHFKAADPGLVLKPMEFPDVHVRAKVK